MADRPSLLDAIAATPEKWPEVQRVEHALSDRAASYKSDADKLRARPLPDWPQAVDVYDEVARVLADIARDLRRENTSRS